LVAYTQRRQPVGAWWSSWCAWSWWSKTALMLASFSLLLIQSSDTTAWRITCAWLVHPTAAPPVQFCWTNGSW
jgi:hypothetical protein